MEERNTGLQPPESSYLLKGATPPGVLERSDAHEYVNSFRETAPDGKEKIHRQIIMQNLPAAHRQQTLYPVRGKIFPHQLPKKGRAFQRIVSPALAGGNGGNAWLGAVVLIFIYAPKTANGFQHLMSSTGIGNNEFGNRPMQGGFFSFQSTHPHIGGAVILPAFQSTHPRGVRRILLVGGYL